MVVSKPSSIEMKLFGLLSILVYCLCFGVDNVIGKVESTEMKIYNDVFGTNGADYMPGNNVQIRVQTSINRLHFKTYNDKTGLLELSYWIFLSWNIPGGTWDPAKYKGINIIRLPASKLWTPDIVPYVHVGHEQALDYRILVSHTGTATFIPQVITTVSCDSIRSGPRYPRDQKLCKMQFGSWTTHGGVVNITMIPKDLTEDEIDVTALTAHGWKYVKHEIKWKTASYACCPEEYHSIHLNITIERNDIYYGLAITAPGIVVGLIVALLYIVPPDSPARIISQTICLFIIAYVGISDMREMGSTILMAPAAHYFIGAMVLDLFALIWSIFMAAMWKQASIQAEFSSPKRAGCFEPILSRLECICCLPTVHVPHDHQRIDLQEDSRSDTMVTTRQPVGLSGLQRLGLLLDRLFCLSTIVLLLFLFIYIGGA